MTNTVRDQVQATKVHLYGARRLELRRLEEAVTATDTTLVMDVEFLKRGTLLGFGTELVYVLSVDTIDESVEVVRGFQRSTPSAHGAGEFGEVNPRFPSPFIVAALRDEIASWGESLYSVRTATMRLEPGSSTVLLPQWAAGCYGLIDAHWCLGSTNTIEQWRPLPRALYSRLIRDDLCSPPALQVGETPWQAVEVKATVAVPFCVDVWEVDTDMIDDVGLSRSLLDLPPLGAALRLWSTQEIQRSDLGGQPQPRMSDEVPPGSVSQTLSPLATLIRQRKKEESGKLLARFPIRIQ